MTSQELIKKILKRIERNKILILAGGILVGAACFWYAHKIPVVYAVKSSLFPQNPSSESGSSSKISQLINGSSGKNNSTEANVSIEEVGRSRKVREAVAATRMPEFNNKLAAEVLINAYNEHLGLFGKKMEMPGSEAERIATASLMLRSNYTLKFSKTELLEIVFTSPEPKLLEPFSNLLIDKITLFYKELKVEKAKTDYEFINSKVDSFSKVENQFDEQRIYMDNHTLFVPETKLQFTAPKQNLETEKLRIVSQKTNAVLNREEALWKLQKITPIVQVLDKPEPPFSAEKPSSLIYGAAGFIIGLLLLLFVSIAGILYRYAKVQVHNMLNPPANINTTTTA